jgi:hypothetical protein
MASGITGNSATSGAKQSNTWIQFTLLKQNINTATNAAAPTTAAIGASLVSSSTSGNFDLWSRAYELVQQREGKLMEDYLNHLDTLFINVPPSTSKDLLNPQYIKCVVNQLFDFREKGGIHVQFPTDNTAAREEIEKLAKFLLWSDTIIKATVNTEPHAALAWSGVSLFFYVSDKHGLILVSSSFANNNRLWRISQSIIRQCWRASIHSATRKYSGRHAKRHISHRRAHRSTIP